MITSRLPLKQQAGMMLLEGLIAILIFSLGILAIVGMQAAAVRNVGEAKYRSEASLLANRLLARMWASDRTNATLTTRFRPGGADYDNWRNAVAGALPQVDTYPPEVLIDPDGIVTITVKWRAPSAPAGSDEHKYTAVAQIK
jgi:type IV pilus assembly protein PilV